MKALLRRSFFALTVTLTLTSVSGQSRLGMATSLSNDSLLYASGFRFIGTTVSNLIGPDLPDSVFQKNIKRIKSLQCKIIMCNVLFPGSVKIAGPDVDEEKALRYLESVLKRAKEAGVPNLILGSGGARRLPDGYDAVAARDQFVPLAKKMAQLAKRYGVTIILENLNSTETNFLNTLADAAYVVRKVNHPSFRLNADIYHMMKEGESPEAIAKAGKLIVYCEIAEKEGRTLPGVARENFVPYLAALLKTGFSGPIIIEGNSKDLPRDVPAAFAYLTSQLEAAKAE